ncbi:OmpA family protein [Nesterenkonia halophila]|uniref:OmpA family protein n=1 Tax=Nesterenkonia halophila TaxID=302044 RepID=UPI0014797603|nr:OmpA family protein [Nesterenkonia halophila]
MVAGVIGTVADPTSPEDLPDPSSSAFDGSVHAWTQSGIDASVHQWTTESLEDSVQPLEQTREEEGTTVIDLATDILFEVNAWELPGSAEESIAELIADVPDGAAVTITGHTDSTPTGETFDNGELSENRAQAVADAVSGAGDSDPAVSEDPEEPSTLAANRRVEIRYSGD